MNTNPDALRVLCYGDSITRWKMPEQLTRYKANERRTGVMQQELGEDYEVIEEWLRGRTTHLDHPVLASRNWLETFYPILMSHLPLDYLVIFLWTNNFQFCFLNTEKINPILWLKEYGAILQEWCGQFGFPLPKVVLVSPPWLDIERIEKSPSMISFFNEASVELFQTQETSAVYQSLANSFGRNFFDAAEVIWLAAGDGVHLTLEQNRHLGETLAEYISHS